MDSFRKMLARIALRYDTAISRAMLRAIGISPPGGRASKQPPPAIVPEGDVYDGLLECMDQKHGVRL